MQLSFLFVVVSVTSYLFEPVEAERVISIRKQRYPIRSRTYVRDLSEDLGEAGDSDSEDGDDVEMSEDLGEAGDIDSEDGDNVENSDDSDDSDDGDESVEGSSVPPEWVSETTNWTDYNSSQLDCHLYRTLSAASGQLQMKEVVDPLSKTVTFEMTYQGHAWLGVALASNGKMIGNVVVVGRPNEPAGIDNPAKFRTNDETVAGLDLLPEEYQTLSNTSLKQNATHTVMRFTQLLNETSERAIVTAPETNTAMYAVGGGNDLGMHEHQGVFQIMLTYCLKPGQDPNSIISSKVQASNTSSSKKSIWIAHGMVMALAWALFVPLAIGSSLLRNLFSDGVWFHLHKICNGIAMTLMIVAFILALVNGDSNLSLGGHPTLGVILFTLCMVQVISGFVRPKYHPPPQQPNAKGVSMNKNATERLSITEEHTGVAGDLTPIDLNEPDTLIQHTCTKVEVVDTLKKEAASMPQEPTAPTEDKEDTQALHSKPKIRLAWELLHRIFGVGVLGLAWVTSNQGLDLLDDLYDTGHGIGLFFWISSATILGVVLLIKIYQKIRSTNHP